MEATPTPCYRIILYEADKHLCVAWHQLLRLPIMRELILTEQSALTSTMNLSPLLVSGVNNLTRIRENYKKNIINKHRHGQHNNWQKPWRGLQSHLEQHWLRSNVFRCGAGHNWQGIPAKSYFLQKVEVWCWEFISILFPSGHWHREPCRVQREVHNRSLLLLLQLPRYISVSKPTTSLGTKLFLLLW